MTPPLLELVLRALGPRGQQVLDLLHRGQTTFALTMANPRGFVVNLVEGVRLGFSQFAHNALRHLGNAFTTWLFGDVEGGLRLELPITGAGLFQFGLSVLNLGYAQLRQKLVKRLGARGEQVVGILEKAASLVHTLVTEGPAAAGRELLDMARTALDGLKQQVLDGLREWLMQTLLLKGVQKLALLLSPASALLETLLQTYHTVVFFIERAEAIDGILSQLLRVALDFLARTFRLDKLPKLLRMGLNALCRPVDKGINWVIDKIIKLAKKAWQAIKRGGKAVVQAGRDAVGAVKGWLGIHEQFKTVNGETHELYFRDGELVRASTAPQEITKFLNGLLAKAQADGDTKQEGKIMEALDEVGRIKLITRTASSAADNIDTGKQQQDITEAIKKLAQLLFDLVPGLRWSNQAGQN